MYDKIPFKLVFLFISCLRCNARHGCCLNANVNVIQSRRGSAAGGVTEGPSVVIQFRDDAVDSQGINIILLVFCMRYILHSIHYIDIFYY